MQITRTLTASLIVAAAALAGTAHADSASAVAASSASLSKVEVQADLNLWRSAGLEGLETPSADYEARLATYQRLRSGPEYLAEVRRLGGPAQNLAGQASERANP